MQFKQPQRIWTQLLRVLSISTAQVLLSGCPSVAVNDEIAYGLKPAPLGAVSVHTLFSGQTDLTEADWLNLRATTPMICTSAATFGDVKGEIEKLCSVCNCCDYSTVAAVNAFFNKISQLKVK